VLLFDNLSRPGGANNIDWLKSAHGGMVQFERGDVRDSSALRQAAGRASQVFHFAAQVAVTTSLESPMHDFEINGRGTLNLLEALRALDNPPPLVFASTDKVYGRLGDVKLLAKESRYEPVDGELCWNGFDEHRAIDFHSPYGCSKGAAEQYVLDYSRTFGLRTVVFRMSSIYGPHQFGTEDQGWVAHFLIRAIQGQPITIFGDGKQVRDVLYVDDAVDAYLLARARIGALGGHAFNLGGGLRNTVSLLELLARFTELGFAFPQVQFAPWRPGDQRYYVSDASKFQRLTGWRPKTSVAEGLRHLQRWVLGGSVGPIVPEIPPEIEKVPA